MVFIHFVCVTTLALADTDTTCSASIFANALKESAKSGAISEDAHESDMQVWIYSILENKENLQNVLNCPEFTSVDDDDSVIIMPIQYVFPNGREIVINYETTPTVLNQKILLSEKQDLPSGPHSADLTDGDAIWTNVDPAWYAIMVVEHGTLDEFVGNDKNNTISMKYIDEHIDDLYPRDHNGTCTSKSAIAKDKASINESVKITVGIGKDDSNDYYVAGDRNLGWIMYTEIALDVVITVATMGGGALLAGWTKNIRILKNVNGMRKTMEELIKGNKLVAKFVEVQNKIYRTNDRLNEIQKALKASSKLSPEDIKKLEQQQKQLTKNIDSLNKKLDDIRKADKTGDVAEYEKASQGGILKRMEELKQKCELCRSFSEIKNNIFQIEQKIQDITDAIKGGKYVPTEQELKKITDAEQNLQRIQAKRQAAARANKGKKEMDKLRAQEKTAQQELNRLKNNIDRQTTLEDIARMEQEARVLSAELKTLNEELDSTRKADKTGDIRKYEEASQTLDDTIKYADTLRGTRALLGAKRGNVATRVFKTFKGLNATIHGEKTLNKGARIARSSMKSGRAKDWLFHSTMKHLGRLGKVGAQAGALYAILKFAGDMYDYTETSTGDFTNNIEFKPLLLLSADDIQGQENVINYGMWLLWSGDSISPSDDDAAYLQAMDFAAKFYQDLSEHQNETNSPCNVDIFVVRPIIRNPGDINQELYYLIMNDEPWSTANDQ